MCSVILPSNVSWQQRLISPVWGFRPLHHVADDVRELSVATLRYSSYDDPVPTLDPAKLPYCYSNVIGAAFSPCPPLPPRHLSPVVCCFWSCFCSGALCRFAVVVGREPSYDCTTLPPLRYERTELRAECLSIVDLLDLDCLTFQYLAPTKDTTKQASPCKAHARALAVNSVRVFLFQR